MIRHMAKVTRTYVVDDVDGSTDDVSTILFAAEGTNYEIDLSPANEARLREKLAKFVEAATEVKPVTARRPVPRKSAKAAEAKEDTSAIRNWAKEAGLKVSERGRISAAVQKAFDEAH